MQNVLPESGIEKVERRVLGAADVQIDRHPVGLVLRIPGNVIPVWADEAQVVPT